MIILWLLCLCYCTISQHNYYNLYSEELYFYLNAIIQQHQQNAYQPHTAIVPTFERLESIFDDSIIYEFSAENINIFMIPAIYIWDPVTQFDLDYPVCELCQQSCNIMQYNDQKGRKPRQILTLTGDALLISARYKCNNIDCNYYTLATSIEYMENIASYYQIQFPIHLSYRSGMHYLLHDTCVNSINQGTGIKPLHRLIKKLNKQQFIRRKIQFTLYWKNRGKIFAELANFPNEEQMMFNKNHRNMIKQWFIHDYMNKQKYYDYLWQQTTHNGVIITDHTFKSAAKVKIFTDSDKYLKQFAALYDIHTNDRVLLCKFVISTEFNAVKDLHQEIENKAPVKLLCVDKCCENEEAILSIHPYAQIK